MTQDIPRLRQQLQQLKAQNDGGALDDAAYAAAKAPLERQLLDQVLDAPAAPAAAARPSARLLSLVSAAALALASAGYLWTGSPGMPSAGPPGSRTDTSALASNGDTEAQFLAAVEQLAQRLQQEPDNAEGWAMLARSYARLGRHADAAPAFEKAIALQGNDARLLVDFADTLAMQNGRNLAGRPTELVQRALQLDPDNFKALALAGTAAFNAHDYAAAVRHWEKLALAAPADSEFSAQLQSSIAEARSRAGLAAAKPQPAIAAGAAPATFAQAAAPAAAHGGVLRGSVRLAPALAKLAAPTDTVFIYARAAEGPRLPLAILRHQVKDLPLDFELDDSSAMSPATRLSGFAKVVVSARISKTGQAMPSAGDLVGESAAVANSASGVSIEIAQVIKP